MDSFPFDLNGKFFDGYIAPPTVDPLRQVNTFYSGPFWEIPRQPSHPGREVVEYEVKSPTARFIPIVAPSQPLPSNDEIKAMIKAMILEAEANLENANAMDSYPSQINTPLNPFNPANVVTFPVCTYPNEILDLIARAMALPPADLEITWENANAINAATLAPPPNSTVLPSIVNDPPASTDRATDLEPSPPIYGRCPVCAKELRPRCKVTGAPQAPVVGTGYDSRAKCSGCNSILVYIGSGEWRLMTAGDYTEDDAFADRLGF